MTSWSETKLAAARSSMRGYFRSSLLAFDVFGAFALALAFALTILLLPFAIPFLSAISTRPVAVRTPGCTHRLLETREIVCNARTFRARECFVVARGERKVLQSGADRFENRIAAREPLFLPRDELRQRHLLLDAEGAAADRLLEIARLLGREQRIDDDQRRVA